MSMFQYLYTLLKEPKYSIEVKTNGRIYMYRKECSATLGLEIQRNIVNSGRETANLSLAAGSPRAVLPAYRRIPPSVDDRIPCGKAAPYSFPLLH